MNHLRRNMICILLLSFLGLSLAGCEGFGFLAVLFDGNKVPPAYELKPCKTLVMVDDPASVLPDKIVQRVIENNIVFHIDRNLPLQQNPKEEPGVPVISFVPLTKLYKVQSEMEDDFDSVPIDRIGKKVGADQVIFVTVTDFRTLYAGALYKPTASLDIKVIDVESGRRVFPKRGKMVDKDAVPPGYLMTAELNYKSSHVKGPGNQQEMQKKLAEYIGRQIAELFYKHKLPEIGSTLPG